MKQRIIYLLLVAILICSGAKAYANETFDESLYANTPEIIASKMPPISVEVKAKNKLAAPVCPEDLTYCYICFKENPELTMAEVICEYSNDIGNETIVITLIHRRANDLFEQGIQVMSHTGERIFCGQIQTISYCESLNF